MSEDTTTALGASPPANESPGDASALRFVARFLAVLVVLYTAYALTKRGVAFDAHREGIAIVSGWILALPFDGVVRTGATLAAPGQAGLSIGEGCDAIYAVLCFVGAVVAFPSTWRQRLRGLLLGLLVIEALNVVRIVSLFVIQRYAPSSFHVAHTTVWEAVFVLVAALMWSVWAARVASSGAPRSASTDEGLPG